MVDYEDIETELTELSLTQQLATDDQMKAAKATSQDKLLGAAYLMCSNKHRFGKMVEDIHNAYLIGQDEYPKSVNDAYYHICNWSNDQETSLPWALPIMFFHLHRHQLVPLYHQGERDQGTSPL